MKRFKKDDVVKCVKMTGGLKRERLYTIQETIDEGDVPYCMVCHKAHGPDVMVFNKQKMAFAACRFKLATKREEILYRLYNNPDVAFEIKKRDRVKK